MKNLKVILIFVVAFCSYYSSSAQEQLVFAYDAAGNQISRQWICVNCTAQQPGADKLEKLDNSLMVKQVDSIPMKSTLIAFPNPVNEMLRVEWTTINGIFVKNLEVFSLNGTKVFGSSVSSKETSSAISFADLPPGGYILRAFYTDGKQQVLKLIKE
ncbi:MAG: T9SS type A sorting domain-containing protein [Sphingobacteriaceae bacterium]|nr:T9SS type A sorting domain-containing protein [Sphingobacteriaceae bacterium]